MPNNRRIFPHAAAVALALVAAVPGARAFDLIRESGQPVTWDPGDITILVKLGAPTTLEDGTTFNSTVLASLAEWNAVLRRVRFVGEILQPSPAVEGGGGNEMVFNSTVFGSSFGNSTLAVTTSFRTGGARADGTFRRTQSDVLFNSARTWGSYRGQIRFSVVDLRRVATHELGHVLGLDHPDQDGQEVTAIMNSIVGNVDLLAQDDIDGGQFLYGEPEPVVRPANDDFANAAILAPALTTQGAARSTSATLEAGEPAHIPDETGGRSVWWRYTAPVAGSLTAVTAGTNFDSVMAAYTGSTLAGLTQIGFNDDVVRGVVRTSTLTFPVTGGATYFFAVDGWSGEGGSIRLGLSLTAAVGQAPVVTAEPANREVLPDGTATFTASAVGTALGVAWQRNGNVLPSASSGTLSLPGVQPIDTGLITATFTDTGGLSVTSQPAILGLLTNQLLTGAGNQVLADTVHPNGNIFDQVLLTGTAVAIKPDAGQVSRVSFIDLNDDIVQVEMSGAGTLSLVLDLLSGPAAPVKYNQPTTLYMRGLAGLVIAGADETTNLTLATVGRLTAFDPTGGWDLSKPVSETNDPANNRNPLFRDDLTYDGIADLGFVAISSANGKFGGLRGANASFSGTRGFTGVYAPGVEFQGPVFVGDIVAFDNATPVLQVGAAADVRITGGDLNQANGRPVRVSGFTQLRFAAGVTSHNTPLPAQTNKARLERDGVDVTAQLVVGP